MVDAETGIGDDTVNSEQARVSMADTQWMVRVYG
jgi:hypothetical protein